MEKWKISATITLFKNQKSKDNNAQEDLWYWRLEYNGIVAVSYVSFETEEEAKKDAKHAKYVFSITEENEFI